MDILFVTGVSANDIFIYNMAKWLHKKIKVNIDIFAIDNHESQSFDSSYYREVKYVENDTNILKKKLLGWTQAYRYSKQLTHFLEGKKYDIIHCHWLVPTIVINNRLKKHCDKLFITFWGGEFENITIFKSKKLYRYYLNRLAITVDGIINSEENAKEIIELLPSFRGNFYDGSFGSEPLEDLYDLMNAESKNNSKSKLSIPNSKLSVLIGYSGKSLHQHLAIIESLMRFPELKEKIIILAPMTRNFDDSYVNQVKQKLELSGFDYWIRKGFLTSTEIAQLRNATDVTLQFAKFDGFSRSIVECICAKSLLIYGDWIDYEAHLKRFNFFAIKTKTIEEGLSVLLSYINSPEDFNDQLEKNHINGKHSYFWSECIDNWIKAYLK